MSQQEKGKLPFGKRKYNFWQNYFPNDDINLINQKKPELRRLFREMLLHPDTNNINQFYEILSNYENEKIRLLANEILEKEILKLSIEKIRILFRLWLNYPVQDITKILMLCENRLKTSDNDNDKVILSIAKIFDKQSNYNFDEVQLSQIEVYVKPFPLLYKPIQRKIDEYRKNQVSAQLRHEQQIVKYTIKDKEPANFYINENRIIFNKRLLAINNPSVIWERLLNSSIVILIEYFSQINLFKKWTPNNEKERQIFEILKETFQGKGWQEHENILLWVIECNLNFIQQYNFHIEINPYLLHFPDQINLTYLSPDQLKVKCTNNESYRKVIKIFLNDDFKLLSLELDTSRDLQPEIQNWNCVINNEIQLNLRFLFALIKPMIFLKDEEISELKEKHFEKDVIYSDKSNIFQNAIIRRYQKYHYFFQQIADFLIQKKFSLTFLEEIEKLAEKFKISSKENPIIKTKSKKKTSISLSIDFGNFKTTICAFNKKSGKIINSNSLVKDSCKNNFQLKNYGLKCPSIILIHPEKGNIFGNEQQSYLTNSLIIWGMKRKIRNNVFENYQILGKGLNLLDATRLFFEFIFNSINWDNLELKELAFAYPVDSSPEYRVWLKEILTDVFNLPEHKINFIDEATANCLGLVVIKDFEIKLNQLYLIIDIGGGTTDCAILKFKSLDGKQGEIFSRKSDSVGGSSIEQQLFFKIKRKNEFKIDQSLKDRLIYQLGIAKIKLFSGVKKILNLDFEGNKISIQNSDFEDIIKEKRIIHKILNVIDDCINEGAHFGAKSINYIILTGGGCKTPIIKQEIINFCKNKISLKSAEIIPLHEDFAVALGLRSLFLGLNIQAKILDDIGIFDFNKLVINNVSNHNPKKANWSDIKNVINNISSHDFKIYFKPLIKKLTRFPTPYYRFEINSNNLNQNSFIFLHFYTVRELSYEEDEEWDLSIIKKRKEDQRKFISERLTNQYILIPNLNLFGNSQNIYLRINEEKKILIYFKVEEKSDLLKEIEIGKVR